MWLTFSVLAALLIGVAATADDTIPSRFDSAGSVTSEESRLSFVASIGGIGLAIAALFGGARWWIPRVPAQAINLPGRDAHRYWTDPVRRSQFDHMISEDLEWIAAASLILLAWMTLVSGTADASDAGTEVNAWLLAVPTVAYLIGIVGYGVYLVRGGKYRVPV